MNFFKRKRLLIIPAFQMSFLRYSLGIAVIVSSIYYASVRYFFYKFHGLATELGIAPENALFRFLKEQELVMSSIFLITTLAVSLVLIAYGLYYSNRIAGPIYNMQRHFKQIAEGRLPRNKKIQFRSDDYFHEMAEAANEALGDESHFHKESA